MLESEGLRMRRAAAPVIALLFALILGVGAALLAAGSADAQTQGREVTGSAPVGGTVPGQSLGATSDSEFWKELRRGMPGTVSIPDKQAGVMIQSQGENWRSVRNGPVTVIGGTFLLVMIALIALFFLVRGRIKIDAGMSGRTMERFNGIERFAHWLTAVTFILLAVTGLNMLYGRYLFAMTEGGDRGDFGALHTAFAAITYYGKFIHNFLSFGFMLGIVLCFVLWVRHNIPNKLDLKWLAVGGGLFVKNVHPPARKFNAGQKLIFWLVVLGGLSLSLSGIALLFPQSLAMFDGTFQVLNAFGLDLPTGLTATQEMQLQQIWHGAMAIVMIGVIIGHIYIGSLGMEGAFAAMGSGMVDENWAREHHGLWVQEVKGGGSGGHGSAQPQPAE